MIFTQQLILLISFSAFFFKQYIYKWDLTNVEKNLWLFNRNRRRGSLSQYSFPVVSSCACSCAADLLWCLRSCWLTCVSAQCHHAKASCGHSPLPSPLGAPPQWQSSKHSSNSMEHLVFLRFY